MRLFRSVAAIAFLVLLSAPARAQPIIAQTSGIPNPGHVITFGANLFPNFTPVSTQFTGIVLTHARYFTTGVSNNLVGGFITNDPIGPPDTLRIQFASPIRDLSLVYHQISTSQPSVFRAMLGGLVVDSFSNLSNQSQPNNYFGFTNVVFDELQIDFVADFNVDTLAYNDAQASCTFRNGTGINPPDYSCSSLPVLGTVWQGTMVTNPNTIATWLGIGLSGPHIGIPYLGGEVLIDLTVPPILLPGLGSYAIALPNTASLLGLFLPTQGVRVDAVGPAQTVTLLNALDLVLGP